MRVNMNGSGTNNLRNGSGAWRLRGPEQAGDGSCYFDIDRCQYTFHPADGSYGSAFSWPGGMDLGVLRCPAARGVERLLADLFPGSHRPRFARPVEGDPGRSLRRLEIGRA